MLTFAIAVLFPVAAIVAVLTLADCALRVGALHRGLRREIDGLRHAAQLRDSAGRAARARIPAGKGRKGRRTGGTGLRAAA